MGNSGASKWSPTVSSEARYPSPKGHFNLFFDEHWNLKSDIHSYGPNIEGGWLLASSADFG